ncbi:hypothetical protein quinque_014666 [Culex quinquefasciatus]
MNRPRGRWRRLVLDKPKSIYNLGSAFVPCVGGSVTVLFAVLCGSPDRGRTLPGRSPENASSVQQSCSTIRATTEDRPRRCVPDFRERAFGVPIVASSTCGLRGPAEVCDSPELLVVQCHQCDDSVPRKRFPASALTGVNLTPTIATCWRSGNPLPCRSASTNPPDNVSLRFHPRQKYEPNVLLQLPVPPGLRPSKPRHHHQIQRARSPLHLAPTTVTWANPPRTGSRIAFQRTLEGRPLRLRLLTPPRPVQDSGHRHRHPHRLPPAPDAPGSPSKISLLLEFPPSPPPFRQGTKTRWKMTARRRATHSLTLTHHYAVSDFAVGGRCKCNGHGSKCVTGRDGELACDCKQ